MATWTKNNLRLLKEEQELSDSSIFDEGLWQELIAGSELGLTPVEQQRQTRPKPSTPPTTTTRGRRVATGGASSTT